MNIPNLWGACIKIKWIPALCVFMAVALAGCGTAEIPPIENQIAANEPCTEIIETDCDFKVQYIRTDGYSDGETYPKTCWITSTEELDTYYTLHKGQYDLDRIGHPASDQTIGFADAVKDYDDGFFETNDLLLVVLEEGSGSIRHEVTGVRQSPSQTGSLPHSIQPEILRLVPEVGTADMAEWHIIIEVSKAEGRSVSECKPPILK